jgi:hypothetical protein
MELGVFVAATTLVLATYGLYWLVERLMRPRP